MVKLLCVVCQTLQFPHRDCSKSKNTFKNSKGEIELGGVIYSESADKAARFIMECNQTKTPLLFIQDVAGFMVGKDAEHLVLSVAVQKW